MIHALVFLIGGMAGATLGVAALSLFIVTKKEDK